MVRYRSFVKCLYNICSNILEYHHTWKPSCILVKFINRNCNRLKESGHTASNSFIQGESWTWMVKWVCKMVEWEVPIGCYINPFCCYTLVVVGWASGWIGGPMFALTDHIVALDKWLDWGTNVCSDWSYSCTR